MATVKFNEKRQRWIIRYYDHNGQRGWESMPKGTSAKDAKKRCREIEESVERKTFKRPRQIPTFREVADQWLQAKTFTIRHSTLRLYENHVKKYLIPFFGSLKANEITLEVVERFITEHSNAGIFPNTLRKIISTLSTIMKYASHPKRCYAPFNPVPYVENLPKAVKQEAEVATVEEVLAIANEMKSTEDKLIVLLMAISGCREGEIFGLKWPDIQWRDSQIFIRRTFNSGRFYQPKSERSKRKIDIPEQLLVELRKWKLACPVNELNLIFPNDIGNPLDATNWLKRVWHPARRRADIRELTPHSLRHFSGSFLLEQGESVGYVQDFLGHATIGMTMDVYRHKLKKQNREAAEKMGRVFFGTDGCKMGANEPEKRKTTLVN